MVISSGMISRPLLLVLLLVVLMLTSQFEWKLQLANGMEANPSLSQKLNQLLYEEEIAKEKIILSQEKTIQQLNQLVHSLQLQLLQCQGSNKTVNHCMVYDICPRVTVRVITRSLHSACSPRPHGCLLLEMMLAAA